MYVYVTGIPTSISLFKVNNLKARTLCEIFSKLAIKISNNFTCFLELFSGSVFRVLPNPYNNAFARKKKIHQRCLKESYLRLSLSLSRFSNSCLSLSDNKLCQKPQTDGCK